MRKSVNVNKRTNIKCEHCAYYELEERLPGRGSIGNCKFNDKSKRVKYYQRCKHFNWSANYLISNVMNKKYNVVDDNQSNLSEPVKYACKRCGRPLTDSDSIARGFGKSCYEQRLRAMQKRLKRLF